MAGSKSANLFACTMQQIVSYVGHTYQHRGDICRVVETFTRLTLPTPPAPPVLPGGHPDPMRQAIFQEQVKEFVK